MKIVLLPLDERPCNYLYPQQLPLESSIEIVEPSKSLLSSKKEVCDINKLSNWLYKECLDADYAVISVDTLLFGGIIPSRIHHYKYEDLINKIEIIKKIKENNKKIKIYCNELIMRCPSYSLSDEECDYYAECGRELFLLGNIIDKEEQNLIEKDSKDKKELLKKIKPEYLNDFLTRRETNLGVLLNNIKYVLEGYIDFFVIPQDDCSEFGFPSRDQRKVKSFLKENNLQKVVVMYPGADEIGLILVARAINDYKKYKPRIYISYASELGKNSIPMFEDRPVCETIKYHLYSANCYLASSISEADIILAINLGSEFAGKFDNKKELIYGKNRNLVSFVDNINNFLELNKITGIADIAYCNESDPELIALLKEEKLLYKIHAYAGWNTSSNTIGTVISNLVSYYYSKDNSKKNFSLYNRYLDDYCFMHEVREKINIEINDMKNPNISIFYLGSYKDQLEKETKDYLLECLEPFNYDFNKHVDIDVDFVWNRTFEAEFKINK